MTTKSLHGHNLKMQPLKSSIGELTARLHGAPEQVVQPPPQTSFDRLSDAAREMSVYAAAVVERVNKLIGEPPPIGGSNDTDVLGIGYEGLVGVVENATMSIKMSGDRIVGALQRLDAHI